MVILVHHLNVFPYLGFIYRNIFTLSLGLCKFYLSCQQVSDENVIENPFSNFRIGQTLSARIMAKANKSENNSKHHQWELSIKPELLTGEVI